MYRALHIHKSESNGRVCPARVNDSRGKCDCCKTITNIQSDTTCLLAELIQHGLKFYFHKVNFVLCIFLL
jgi:hypothetical protein